MNKIRKKMKKWTVVSFAMTFLIVPMISLAGYQDKDKSTDGSIEAGVLDAEISSIYSELQPPTVASDMEAGENVIREGDIENIGTIDFQYDVFFEKLSGDDELCSALQLDATFNGNNLPVVDLSDFDYYAGTLTAGKVDEWDFTITLPADSGHELEELSCEFDFVFEAYQTTLPVTSGWSIERKIGGNLINSGNWIAPAKPVITTIYKGHDPATWVEVGCGGYTNDTEITIEWEDNTESDLAGYWLGTKFNDHHKWIEGESSYKANMTPGNNPYYYTIIAEDTAGHESVISDQCGLILDQDNPTVELTNLSDGDTVSGPVTIKGSVEDDNPHYYYLVIKDSGGNVVAGPGTVNESSSLTDVDLWSWDTTTLSDGDYTVQLAARDAADNKGSVSVQEVDVTVENSILNNVVLNEFLPNPDSSQSGVSEDDEWVELYNLHSSNDYDVAGWEIYDNVGLRKTISSANTNTGDTIVPANGTLVVYLEDSYLNNTSDKVELQNGSGVVVDSYEYSGAGNKDGKSYARMDDGIGPWIDPTPTPGEENKLTEEEESAFQEETFELCFDERELKSNPGKNKRGEDICNPIFLEFIGMLEDEDDDEMPKEMYDLLRKVKEVEIEIKVEGELDVDSDFEVREIEQKIEKIKVEVLKEDADEVKDIKFYLDEIERIEEEGSLEFEIEGLDFSDEMTIVSHEDDDVFLEIKITEIKKAEPIEETEEEEKEKKEDEDQKSEEEAGNSEAEVAGESGEAGDEQTGEEVAGEGEKSSEESAEEAEDDNSSAEGKNKEEKKLVDQSGVSGDASGETEESENEGEYEAEKGTSQGAEEDKEEADSGSAENEELDSEDEEESEDSEEESDKSEEESEEKEDKENEPKLEALLLSFFGLI